MQHIISFKTSLRCFQLFTLKDLPALYYTIFQLTFEYISTCTEYVVCFSLCVFVCVQSWFLCLKLGEVTQKCHHTKSRQHFWLFFTVWKCIHTSLIWQNTKQHSFIYHVSQPDFTLNCAEYKQVSD